jgi:hypothetical protein
MVARSSWALGDHEEQLRLPDPPALEAPETGDSGERPGDRRRALRHGRLRARVRPQDVSVHGFSARRPAAHPDRPAPLHLPGLHVLRPGRPLPPWRPGRGPEPTRGGVPKLAVALRGSPPHRALAVSRGRRASSPLWRAHRRRRAEEPHPCSAPHAGGPRRVGLGRCSQPAAHLRQGPSPGLAAAASLPAPRRRPVLGRGAGGLAQPHRRRRLVAAAGLRVAHRRTARPRA